MSTAAARTRRRLMGIALSIVTFVGVLVYLFPYTWMIMTAIRRPVETFALPPVWLFEPQFHGFIRLFGEVAFYRYLINSGIVTVTSVVVTMAIATTAAYALAKMVRNSRPFLISILLARMIPPIALVVPIYLMASTIRQLDTYQVLILVNVAFNLPFAVWMLRSFFIDVPTSLREAALIDGASEMQIMVSIMLPIVRIGILATAVFIFIAAWNEFLFALVLTGTHTATSPVAILSFRSARGIEWDTISAAAFLVSLPVIIFAFAMQRYLVQGLTLGAVK